MGAEVNSLKSFVIWIVVTMLSILVLFKVMGSMLVYDDADITLRARVCPLAGQAVAGEYCRVHGSVSRTLLTEEVEIMLANGSRLLIHEDDMLGFGHPGTSVRYEPFGKFFALVAGLAIILLGWWLSIGAPRPKAVQR